MRTSACGGRETTPCSCKDWKRHGIKTFRKGEEEDGGRLSCHLTCFVNRGEIISFEGTWG